MAKMYPGTPNGCAKISHKPTDDEKTLTQLEYAIYEKIIDLRWAMSAAKRRGVAVHVDHMKLREYLAVSSQEIGPIDKVVSMTRPFVKKGEQ